MHPRLKEFTDMVYQDISSAIQEGAELLPITFFLVHKDGFSYVAAPIGFMTLPEELALELVKIGVEACRHNAEKPTLGIVSLTVGKLRADWCIGLVVEQPGAIFEQFRRAGEPLEKWRILTAPDPHVRWMMEENRTYESKAVHHA